ncbi:MAG TPA: hypothetical protein PK999_17790 [Nitrospira sp.]|nr:hypothetical protein [Nitrospira sp.]
MTINAGEVTLEQFRDDLPRITRQLEKHIVTSRAEASRITGE